MYGVSYGAQDPDNTVTSASSVPQMGRMPVTMSDTQVLSGNGQVSHAVCSAWVFCLVGLGLPVKIDDSKSRLGGPCSELWGACTDPEASQLLSHAPGQLRSRIGCTVP